jgi:hypothetical protein
MSSGSAMAVLMYDDLRELENPGKALMEFLETTYQAGASLNEWPESELLYKVPE